MQRDYPAHIVAVGGLVENSKGEILLLKSPRYGDWEFPGGQVEEGETLPQALAREIVEETGIKTEIKSLAGVYSNVGKPPIVIMDFLCDYISGEPRNSDESSEVKWIEPVKALSLVKREAIHKRLRDMLNFSDEITYRAYLVNPYQSQSNYEELVDRKI